MSPVLVSRADAASMMGLSLRHFQRYVQPDLPVVRIGRRTLVPVIEVEHWISERVEEPPSRRPRASLTGTTGNECPGRPEVA